MPAKQTGSDIPDDIKMLQELKKKMYDQLMAVEDGNPKIGDFIKMIEAERKLAPMDAEQKEFWNMLEQIRKQKLGKNDRRKTGKRKTAKE